MAGRGSSIRCSPSGFGGADVARSATRQRRAGSRIRGNGSAASLVELAPLVLSWIRVQSGRKRSAGQIHVKHGSYDGRGITPGCPDNRKLDPVRRPGIAKGLTRTQARKRLRERASAFGASLAADEADTFEAGDGL